MKLIAFLLFHLSALSAFAQTNLSGCIRDSENKEPLIGANIYTLVSENGTITNEYGHYKLKLIHSIDTVTVSYLGYNPKTFLIDFQTDTVLDIYLEPRIFSEEAIIIAANKVQDIVNSAETDALNLNAKEISRLPALLGETDFLKVIQLTPGIQAANDANMGFYVRGGGADQNLVLLDNITVYNPSHVMGFFSVFNTNAIGNAKIIKSGIPANYGGRISSITDLSTRNPNLKQYRINGSIGLLLSKFTIEGPIQKNKSGFSVSVRRTYLDEILKPAIRPLTQGNSTFYNHSKYHFYDINGKIYWKLNSKNTCEVTAYNGQDFYSLEKLKLDYKNKMIWGNKVFAANWLYRPTKDWNIITTSGYTNYKFQLNAFQQNVTIDMLSNVEDLIFKTGATYANNNGTIIKFGFDYNHHTFMPNNLDAKANSLDLNFGSNRLLKAHESALYYSHETNISSRIRIIAGVRSTFFLHTGPYYEIQENDIGELIDSTYYQNNEPITPKFSLEPRLSTRYQIDQNSSLKASFSLNDQYIHMVSPSSVTLPTDVWIPTTKNIQPQKGIQLTSAYHRYFNKRVYYSSIGLYYKKYNNQVELLSGIINDFNDNSFEKSMTFGKGCSYGAEFYIQKRTGLLNGWISYTLSYANRQFDQINQGKIYPAKYDRRHELNLILNYQFSKRLEASGSFIFASGNAYTIPEYKYLIEGNVVSGTEIINGFRMPAYHRLDLSLNFIHKKTLAFESMFNFSVFNVYNRANPFYIYFELEGNISEYNLSITPKQVSVFPILPSITWLFKFQ